MLLYLLAYYNQLKVSKQPPCIPGPTLNRMTLWPLYELSISGNHNGHAMVLRYSHDDDLYDLAELREEGVVPSGCEHWTPGLLGSLSSDRGERIRGFVQRNWVRRGQLRADSWGLPLCILVDGQVCGLQTMSAERFNIERTIASGSWLGLKFQGKGYGSWARASMLELAFVRLGARYATTSWAVDNMASARVSAKMGYTLYPETPDQALVRHGVLTSTTWKRTRPDWCDTLSVSGVQDCLQLLGAAPDVTRTEGFA